VPTAPPQKKLNEWDHTAVQTTFFKSCLTTYLDKWFVVRTRGVSCTMFSVSTSVW
jgi:hypothetical protein